MVSRQPSTISYEAPPLVEVAMSVQFDAPKGLNVAHLGAYWEIQKDQLPRIRAAQPIATTNEIFNSQGQWLPPSLQLALTNQPDCRLQMTSADDQWMCQIQLNRLVINWRKRGSEYPRYSATWNRFAAAWKSWLSFLSEHKLAPPIARLWELTYVNQIPQGKLWSGPRDWPGMLPGLWGGAFVDIEQAKLCGFHGQWVWESSHPQARLYVEPKPGRTVDEPSREVLVLSLTARGPVPPSEDSSNPDVRQDAQIETGMQVGHDLIVTTFDKISSKKARAHWRRLDDAH